MAEIGDRIKIPKTKMESWFAVEPTSNTALDQVINLIT